MMKGIKILRVFLCVAVGLCGMIAFSAHTETVSVRAAFECEHEIITVPEVAPTCTQSGTTAWSYCNICDEIFSLGETIAALGHNVVTEIIEPTCTEQGYTFEHCTRCNELDSKTNFTPATGHSAEEIPEVPATCTAAGHTSGERCSACGEVLSVPQEIAALGHSYGEWSVSAPTCDEAGERNRTCSRCGETEREAVAALGHMWGDWSVVSAASCGEDGMRESACVRCGERRSEVISATGHREASGHAKAPACTESGYTAAVFCSVCGTSLQAAQPIPALGHDWGSWTEKRASTCVQRGLLERVCLRGDCVAAEHRETETVPHTEELLPAVPAGCESAGLTEGRRCGVCGEIFAAQEEIAPTGHNWGQWRIVKSPDYKQEGERARSCASCGETQTERIETLGGYGELFLAAVEKWREAKTSEKAEYMKQALALYERVERKDLVAEEYEILRSAADELPQEKNYTALTVGFSCGGAVAVGGAAGVICFLKRRIKK